MLIVHVALEMRVCCVAVPLVKDRPVSGVASGTCWACASVVLRASGEVAFDKSEEICGPVEAASVGRRIPYSLEIPVTKLLTLRGRVLGRVTASVEAYTGKFVVMVTLEYGA